MKVGGFYPGPTAFTYNVVYCKNLSSPLVHLYVGVLAFHEFVLVRTNSIYV